jgi:hypothetical protein
MVGGFVKPLGGYKDAPQAPPMSCVLDYCGPLDLLLKSRSSRLAQASGQKCKIKPPLRSTGVF